MLIIAKRDFHDTIIYLVKWKRLSSKQEGAKLSIFVRYYNGGRGNRRREFGQSLQKPHWARVTMEMLIRVDGMKELVVALIDHESEINLMSMDFYKKGKTCGRYERRPEPPKSFTERALRYG